MPNEEEQEAPEFDFEKHKRDSVVAYLELQGYYQRLSEVVGRIFEECIRARRITVHSVQYRAKDPNSFGKKASIPSEIDTNQPKYTDPLKEITDLAGVRVITHFQGTLADIDCLINEEFNVIERSDKSANLIAENKFGYQSVHYLIKLKMGRSELAEYRVYSESIVEIQVRTILQHAWAEIEHDIQYKSSYTVPTEIRRRFMALAGMLEIADREFQAIQSADRALTVEAETLVRKGDLEGVEITASSLKLFLDRKLGSDGRVSSWNYEWTAKLLRQLGFKNLKQVEAAVHPYSDSDLSRIAEGTRQGQISRFEFMLMAALGEQFISNHPFSKHSWFSDRRSKILEKFRQNSIQVGIFNLESLND